jgi:hypothetical protein
MRKILETLQPLGRALMLPIAVLPVAGLLLRLGQPDMLEHRLHRGGGRRDLLKSRHALRDRRRGRLCARRQWRGGAGRASVASSSRSRARNLLLPSHPKSASGFAEAAATR